MFLIIITAKVGIKSCRFGIKCVLFVHAWMQLTTQLELCVHEQIQKGKHESFRRHIMLDNSMFITLKYSILYEYKVAILENTLIYTYSKTILFEVLSIYTSYSLNIRNIARCKYKLVMKKLQRLQLTGCFP